MTENWLTNIIPPSIWGRIGFWAQTFMFVVSLLTVGAIVVDYGFVLDVQETGVVGRIYRSAWWIYLSAYCLRLLLQGGRITRKTVFMTALLGVLLLCSALPRMIDLSPAWQSLSGIWHMFGSKWFLIIVLGLFSVLEMSRGIVGFINKKTNPALLMAASFVVIIIFGTLLLLLPRSTHEHVRLSVVDALFVSTSAVCVTGLSPVDVAQTFSVGGQMVIALLIQVGGLGVMTITSFFAVFFMGGTGLYNQFALRDMVGSETFSSLISTLLYILGFTFVIELVGAFFIWSSIHATLGMSLGEEIFFSCFHSISAFCNAGFSTLSGNLGNPDILNGHHAFYLIIAFLVVLGGLGFPILMNLRHLTGYYIQKLQSILSEKRTGQKVLRPRYTHLTDINTRIVLVVTLVLIVAGTVVMAVLEWNGAFSSLSAGGKIVQAFFNAVVPRTAGFNSVDLTQFSFLTLIGYMLLMWIGGASQSTAGGIKVNTLAVALANIRSVIRSEENVVMFGREITPDSVRRALAVISASIVTITVSFVLLVILEPEQSPLNLLFEIISAISTVGASLNVTPQLGADSKLLVILLMFAGRVGLITVMMSVVRQVGSRKYRFPKGNVIIN